MKYVLLLSNVRPEDANTTLDHQAALVNRDDASVFVLNPLRNREAIIDFKQFDAIIIHYSLVCFLDNYINIAYRRAIQDFSGLKVIFIQDEYRNIYSAVDAMVGLGIDVLFTMVPKEAIEPIYGRLRRRGVRVELTLAGYAPDNLSKLPQTPLAARPLDVVYRGRLVPFALGRLGTEKVHISKRFEELAPAYGLKVDLDWREEARIYGPDWPKFLSSGRVALGTESGASICDFTGELDKAVSLYLRERPGAAFEDVYRDILHCYEGNVLMNVVSPRVFEAMALCTALVQFPGSYSGVLCVDQHYIPLAKDFSNIDEVVDKIRDVGFLEKLVARAYDDIIRSERYSFRKFGNEVFAVMREEWERRVHTHPHVPMLVGEAAHKKVESWQQLSIDSWREEIERGWREETEQEISERERERELKEIEHRTREIERDNWRKEIERELKEIEHRAQIHNLALANKGAWISASSDFYPRPHDADYVLRSPIAGGYAAAQGGAGDDFIEIDLGRPAQVNAIEIDWFDGENYPRHLRVEGAVMAGEPLEMLFETTGNTSTSSIIPLEPETVLKRVRVAASRFVGEKRMLLRGLRVLGNPEPTESDARAADEIDALDAERGAAILAASGFFPAPHNPAYLLRASGAGGYAAGLHEAGLPQWIEFDLGQPYEVRAVEIAWHSAEELAMDFELMVRGQTTEPWIPYAYEKKNWKQVSFLRRDPILARFVRLSATRFSREKRFLIRAMHVWARDGENYPRHLRVEGAVMAGEPLEMLFETTGNTSTSSIIPLEPETVLKRVRVAASRFVGEKRMLLRGLRVLGNPEPTESDARAADEIDALDAERGAAILAASGFFPAPHNPAYLLRASGAGGYAAGLHEAGLPQWIEFDLGQPYEVRAVEIAWHSAEELAMDFELMVRGQTTEPWIPYAYEKKNWKQVSFLRRDPILARFVRLSATRFSREKRFLIRAMHVWAREPSCASGAESLR